MAVVEIVKALAWPVAVLIVALSYKRELMVFLPPALKRKFKIELPGPLKLEIDAADQQATAVAKVNENQIQLKEIPGLTRTVAISSLEVELHKKLKEISENSQIDILIRNLAQARLESIFGLIYAVIFGSQITGLLELGARRKVPTKDAHEFCVKFEEKFPEVYAGYGFPGWLGFLKSNGLINHEEDNVIITPFGDDFLAWLRANRLSTNKPW